MGKASLRWSWARADGSVLAVGEGAARDSGEPVELLAMSAAGQSLLSTCPGAGAIEWVESWGLVLAQSC